MATPAPSPALLDTDIKFVGEGVLLTIVIRGESQDAFQPDLLVAHALECRALLYDAEAAARGGGWSPRWYVSRPTSQLWAGLDNQGATCYLNSLLQLLSACPEVRACVYTFAYHPETHGVAEHCVPLQLARLFCRIMHSRRHALSTRSLTQSFGWSELEAHRQHDVQELCRVLFDALGKFGVPLAPRLFEGWLRDTLRCVHCGLESARRETFCDVQLNISGVSTLEQVVTYVCTCTVLARGQV